MKATSIKVGNWYETKLGYGRCIGTDSRRPVAFKFEITSPIPRGTCLIAPRDVVAEIDPPIAEASK